MNTIPSTELTPVEQASKAVSRSKLMLMRDKKTVFFSALLANLRVQITDKVPTAATDGVSIKYNPDFVNQQTTSKVVGLNLHEVYHVVYQDMFRGKDLNLDPVLWNISCDHRINLYILNMGYEIPEGGCADPKFKGMSAMQIYNYLIEDPPPQSDQDQTMLDLDIEGAGDPDDPDNEKANRVKTNILKAAQQAEMMGEPGSIPSDVLRMIEEMVEPKLPWQQILAKFITEYAKDDFSWSRPNRRYAASGMYLPHAKSNRLKRIVAGGDVSGSMDETMLSEWCSELRYIWQYLKPISMRIMSFDTEVHDDYELKQFDTMEDMELHGGGGTEIGPFFDALREDQPELALIFTDGWFHMPDHTGITTDLIWVIFDNIDFDPPIGRVIHYD